MPICFHGTDLVASQTILQTGRFAIKTWFAQHLEDALEFGGPYVFGVAFDDPPQSWQFRAGPISLSNVVFLQHYTVNKLTENPILREQIFAAALIDIHEELKSLRTKPTV